MTIEETAREFFQVQEYMECENASDEMWMKKDAFTRGAEWMLDKACEYIKNQYPIHYEEWAALADEGIKNFRKAMEEE